MSVDLARASNVALRVAEHADLWSTEAQAVRACARLAGVAALTESETAAELDPALVADVAKRIRHAGHAGRSEQVAAELLGLFQTVLREQRDAAARGREQWAGVPA